MEHAHTCNYIMCSAIFYFYTQSDTKLGRFQSHYNFASRHYLWQKCCCPGEKKLITSIGTCKIWHCPFELVMPDLPINNKPQIGFRFYIRVSLIAWCNTQNAMFFRCSRFFCGSFLVLWSEQSRCRAALTGWSPLVFFASPLPGHRETAVSSSTSPRHSGFFGYVTLGGPNWRINKCSCPAPNVKQLLQTSTYLIWKRCNLFMNGDRFG